MQELQSALRELKIDSLAIVIFGSPDPDAISSAFALQFILEHADIKSKIYTEKDLSYPNNQSMVNQLDIPLTPLKELKEGIRHYAIVDTPYRELPNHPDAQCVLHIDHHKEATGKALHSYVDVTAKSCATIICEMLKTLELKNNHKRMSKLCVALAYGIYTDTNAYLHASARDFEALVFLKPYYEDEQFQQLAQLKHSPQTMEVIQKALEHKQQKSTFAFSGIGYISAEYRDSLAIAADFLLTQEGVSNVLVFAIVEERGNDYVNGCFRTSDPGMDTKKFMSSFVVNGSGGGRKSAGGFQEPLGFFSECKNKDKAWDLVRAIIEEKIKVKVLLTKAEEKLSA